MIATGWDYDWCEVDPMGHEHRWVGETIPTVDEKNRCLRCGHTVHPSYKVEPARRIVSVSIEARPESVSLMGSSGRIERVPGLTRFYMKVNETEIEISEEEARLAGEAYRKGLLDVYAADLLKKYGFQFA